MKRLTASGVYEAAGNAFWLNLATLFAWEGGGIVLGSEIYWTQLGVGRLFWSEEKSKRSADTWNLRQYNVHCSCFFSTAVSSSAQSTGDSFQGLPCFIGRVLLLGWWSNMDDQLRANNTPMIMKLDEAALSIPIRMRLNPTLAHVAYDTVTHSEDIVCEHGSDGRFVFRFH